MTPIRARVVDSAGVALHVYELGERNNPPVVVLHGMRDVALSLTELAQTLATDYHVLLPDLRGHGLSEKCGNYTMQACIFDLHTLLDTFELPAAALVGHSLGGQIAIRFAALFPERVRAAVFVEGLGPPVRDSAPPGSRSRLQIEAARLLTTLTLPARGRPLPDVEFAASRLLANNPRLAPERARKLAEQGTWTDPEGHLLWAFDPRVGSIFLGVGHEDSAQYWPNVQAPTLIISGAHAHEYWSSAIPAGSDWRGEFAPGELEARVASFPDHEHQIFENSGHMVHYDEPERLADASLDFLRRRYE